MKIFILLFVYLSLVSANDCVLCAENEKNGPCCRGGCIVPAGEPCGQEGCALECNGFEATCPKNNDITMKWLGESAQLQIYKQECVKDNKGPKSSRYMKFSLDGLEEVTFSEGRYDPVHGKAIPSFPSQHLKISGIEKTENAIIAELRGKLELENKEQVDFIFFLDFYFIDIDIAIGGYQTEHIAANSLKFSFLIAGWKFENSENFLKFVGTLETPHESQEIHTANNLTTITFTQGKQTSGFAIPLTCQVDSRDKTFKADIERKGNSFNYELSFYFPSFVYDLSYDPVMNLGKNQFHTSVTGGAAIGIFFSLFCLCSVLVFGFWFLFDRNGKFFLSWE